MAIDPSVRQAANSSMMGLMASDGKTPPPPGDGGDDDGGQVTCPSCGCGFAVQKQTNYTAGPVTTPPSGAGAGGPAGAPPMGSGPSAGGM